MATFKDKKGAQDFAYLAQDVVDAIKRLEKLKQMSRGEHAHGIQLGLNEFELIKRRNKL